MHPFTCQGKGGCSFFAWLNLMYVSCTCVSVCLCTYMYVCICMYAYVCMNMCVCMYIYIYVYVYIYIYICTHPHICTHISCCICLSTLHKVFYVLAIWINCSMPPIKLYISAQLTQNTQYIHRRMCAGVSMYTPTQMPLCFHIHAYGRRKSRKVSIE
jgi:hypothetical protein